MDWPTAFAHAAWAISSAAMVWSFVWLLNSGDENRARIMAESNRAAERERADLLAASKFVAKK